MSAAAIPLDEPRTPLTTLARVELRKMVDTRAGRWLLAIIAVGCIAATVLYTLLEDEELATFDSALGVAQMAISIVLPVLAILSVTSEWSQRTGLSTFTLVPDRWRVIGAKLMAIFALNVAALLFAVVVSAVATAIGGADWSLDGGTVGEVFTYQLLGLVGGFAFGLILQNSAPAIVLYYVLPTIWGILTSVIGALEDPAEWLDTGRAFEPLVDGAGASGKEWARVATASALWVALPLGIGLGRLSRSEIK